MHAGLRKKYSLFTVIEIHSRLLFLAGNLTSLPLAVLRTFLWNVIERDEGREVGEGGEGGEEGRRGKGGEGREGGEG